MQDLIIPLDKCFILGLKFIEKYFSVQMIFVEWSQVLPTGNSHKSFLYLDLLQTISDTSPAFFSISCQVNSDTRVSFISVSVRLLLTLEIPSSVSLSGYF